VMVEEVEKAARPLEGWIDVVQVVGGGQDG
jgi:hypothetical protein